MWEITVVWESGSTTTVTVYGDEGLRQILKDLADYSHVVSSFTTTKRGA
jgi:hypothetical protein